MLLPPAAPTDCWALALQIIVKPTGSKIAMLKTEVDIMTKTDHPNVYVAHPATRHHPLARTEPPISGLLV